MHFARDFPLKDLRHVPRPLSSQAEWLLESQKDVQLLPGPEPSGTEAHENWWPGLRFLRLKNPGEDLRCKENMSKHNFFDGPLMLWGALSDVINCSCMIGVVDGSHWFDPCNSYDSPQNDWWVGHLDTPKRRNQIPAFWDGAKMGRLVKYVCWGSQMI